MEDPLSESRKEKPFVNILFIGDEQVGKSSIIRAKLCENSFNETYKPTVYDTCFVPCRNGHGDEVTLAVWDTAGNQDFEQLRDITAYNAAVPLHIVVLCFAIDDPKTLHRLKSKWVPELEQKTTFPNITGTILVGTRSDLRVDGQGDHCANEDGSKFASENDFCCGYMECSAKTGEGIRELFDAICAASETTLPRDSLKPRSSRSRLSRRFRKSQQVLVDVFSKLRQSFTEGGISKPEDEHPDMIAADEGAEKIKVAFIGDAKSGKRSLANALGTTIMTRDGKLVDLAVGVLSSSETEESNPMLPMSLSFYCGHDTDVIIFCVPANDSESLRRITSYWLPDIYTVGMPKNTVLPMILVGTKNDLITESWPTFNPEVKRVAKQIGTADYLECSAHTGDGLATLRLAIARIYEAKRGDQSSEKQKLENRKSSSSSTFNNLSCNLGSQADCEANKFVHAKLVVVGDGKCGKMALVKAFVNNGYSESIESNPFEQFYKTLSLQDEQGGKTTSFNFEIWKTSGVDRNVGTIRYRDVLRAYSYPDSDVILLCFAVDDPPALKRILSYWLPELQFYCPKVPIVLVGTKADLRNDQSRIKQLAAISQTPLAREECERLAAEIKAFAYVECSTEQLTSVRGVFETAARAVIKAASRRKRGRRGGNSGSTKNNCKQM